jgi:hypothetical protein
VLPADMRRVEGAGEDSPAEAADNREAVADSRVEVGSPGFEGDIPVVADRLAEAGIPAAEDSPAEAGTPAVEDRPAVEGIQAVEDNRVVVGILGAVVDSQAEADSRVVVGTRVAAAGNSRLAAASRRRSYRTWRKRCCPVPPAFRN